MAMGVYEPIKEMPDSKTLYGNISPTYPFGAYLIEVEVDVKTGVVEVKNVIAVHDSGKAINPQMLKGQIEGGVVMGIGFTFLEEMIYIDGILQNSNFTDYKIPTTMEIPLINIHLVETEDPEGPYGAKGVGETPVVPVAPAISNAIFDATGVRVKRLPITPERLRKLLSERNIKC
jgi:xanthine dehydrogenase molybdenum-binding subunit